jgi:hypothetical protein
MKLAPTLIDEVYRASFRPKTNPGWKDNTKVRHALERARRFIVDEPMAGFMAELANESFIKAGNLNPLSLRIADSIRVQSRLPYDAIWIEYPLRSYQRRASEIRAVDPVPEDEQPLREGWLIQQHPGIETAYIMHMWTQSDQEDDGGFRLWTFPFAFAWCADDSPLPWNDLEVLRGDTASSIIVGIAHYERRNVNLVRSPLITEPVTGNPAMTRHYETLLKEWAGVIRRVWSLLATINDIPKTVGEVRQTKGFLARGRIRKYLDHSTITLAIPGKKDTRVLARELMAIAHRRRHPVRAHWRDDWRHPPASQCKHLWEVMDDKADHIQCAACHGRQTYIHKHDRGDATLGWVSHSYNVTHEDA